MLPPLQSSRNTIVKSSQTPADLERFRQKMLSREAQLRRSVITTDRDAANGRSAQLERDLHELQEIDAALERIVAGTYGFCMRCGKPIDRGRLSLFPAARFDMCCMENEEVEHERAAHSSA
jgi:hypothetical protein